MYTRFDIKCLFYNVMKIISDFIIMSVSFDSSSMASIRNVTTAIQSACATKGIDVSATLAAFISRTVCFHVIMFHEIVGIGS